MIGAKCRLSFIQYMPNKPTKWGIKVWACCDSHTGFIYNFDVYTGADPSKPTYAKGLAYNVVLGLLETRLGKDYVVYMDNFYLSPELLEDLLAQNTAASGTVPTNRCNFPKSLKPGQGQKQQSGDYQFLYPKNLIAIRWYDNQDVYALSTLYGGSVTIVRRHVDKEVKEVSCPDTRLMGQLMSNHRR